ncbi:MAG: iron-sulfur cluster assembly accessory protein [Gammaproteobacteria bacterium HGW-Gammaproteobacteria-1]|jgi:iron-sulfur cluster assembly protein|nr:MAG: iron-sulfur cluster assembly accessory protein [Gammaproteobacteria bacterium HGW-Gammaproteobacteria-1]
MITVTPEAAKQIQMAAAQGGMEGLSLRLAARPGAHGGLEYGMGFDNSHDEDLSFNCEGVSVVFEPQYGPLLNGTTIDYVEMEPGQFHFIFMNPNDTGGGCGSGGGGGGCGSGGCGSGGCSS